MKRFKNKSCAVVFFSYRTDTGTKHESPAGDQFWKFRRQCSIFGRIGDQWVTISNPGVCSNIWEVSFVLTLLISNIFSDDCVCKLRENKQVAEGIHSFPSFKLRKHEIVWKHHTAFLTRARNDSKRYAVTKAFFALKGRTDKCTWNITAIARHDESLVTHVWIWTLEWIVSRWQC